MAVGYECYEYVDAGHVARLFKVSRKTVTNMAGVGKLPG